MFDSISEKRVGYDPATGTYHLHADDTGRDSMAYSVLSAVAAVTGNEPSDLPPISRAVDVDAMERLVSAGGEARVQDGVTVTFPYNGCTVAVEAGGHVIVDPPTE